MFSCSYLTAGLTTVLLLRAGDVWAGEAGGEGDCHRHAWGPGHRPGPGKGALPQELAVPLPPASGPGIEAALGAPGLRMPRTAPAPGQGAREGLTCMCAVTGLPVRPHSPRGDGEMAF